MSQKDEDSAAFIDLMTSLAVIFILLFVCVLNEKDATNEPQSTPPSPPVAAKLTAEKAMDDAKKTREDILLQLQSAFRTDGLQVEADPDDVWTLVVIIRQQELTFATNKWALNDEGRKTVEKVFGTIEPIVCDQYAGHIDWVTVEGHTDIEGNATLIGQIDNIDLSSRRASSVVHHALRTLNRRRKGKGEDDLRCIRALLSPRGMGSSHPRSTGAKKELQQDRRAEASAYPHTGNAKKALRQDRRVEVKVHVVAPPITTVEAVNNLPKAADALAFPQ